MTETQVLLLKSSQFSRIDRYYKNYKSTAILEGSQGILETEVAPSPACFVGEKDPGMLLEGDQAQGKKVNSLAKGSENRGRGGPGSRPEQLLCASYWSRPWGMRQRWKHKDPCSFGTSILVSRKESGRKTQPEEGWRVNGFD